MSCDAVRMHIIPVVQHEVVGRRSISDPEAISAGSASMLAALVPVGMRVQTTVLHSMLMSGCSMQLIHNRRACRAS